MTDEKSEQPKEPSKRSPATSVATGLDDDVREAHERIERERAKERLEKLQGFLGRSSRASRPIVRAVAIGVVVALGIGGCFVITRPSQVRAPGPECAVPSSWAGAQEANADAASINAILGEVKMPFFKLLWGADAEVMRQRAYACTATFAAMHGVDAASLLGDVEGHAQTWLDDPERAHAGAQVILAAIAAPNVTPQFPRPIAPLLEHFDRAVVTLGRNSDANRLVLDVAAAAQHRPADERDAIYAAVRRLYPEPEPLLEAARQRKDQGAAALGWLRDSHETPEASPSKPPPTTLNGG